MASVTGIVVTKQFEYRGNDKEEWSNKYWLTGSPPTTPTAWNTLFTQLATAEAACYSSGTKVVGGYAYDDNTPGANSVWSVDWRDTASVIPGTLVGTEGNNMAGDQAGFIEWLTSRKTSDGKWIYLRKYFHDGFISTTDADAIDNSTLAAYQVFMNELFTGSNAMGRRVRSQGVDDVLQGQKASPWVTTRTLKRRGKKKKTP